MWKEVDGVSGIPEGKWVVHMENGKYGYCEIYDSFGVINGAFSFDMAKVVAYCELPVYIDSTHKTEEKQNG